MRIAVWWNLPPGGARRALRDQLRGLSERGHEIHVVRPPVGQPEWMPPDAFATSVQEVPLPDFAPGAGYLGRIIGEMRRVRGAVGAMERHCAEAGRLITALEPDVVFASTCWLMAAPSIVRHIGDLPRTVYLQEPKRSLYEATPRLHWVEIEGGASWPRRFRRRLSLKASAHQARIERENAQAAGTLLVNSLFSKESVQRAYGLDSQLCYLGVDGGQFAFRDGPREPFVLGVGAIAPSKGVQMAIEACQRAKMPLVWVGPYEDEVYGRTVRALGGDRVEWRVAVSDVELASLYGRCAAVIATAPLEPFGYTPLEAASCGAPVVAIAQGGFRETVLDGVTGFLGQDVGDLAAALTQLKQDASLGKRMGIAGRCHIETKWSLERATDRLEAALRSATR